MSGFHLHFSNRSEELADALAELLRRPLGTPLQPETVVVQSRGMERWLALGMAQRLGIWANVETPFPNAMVDRFFATVLPDSEAAPQLRPENLTFALMRQLPELLANPVFAPLRPYLAADDGSGLRLYQLCRRLADLFDQYTVFRPELILAWEAGEERDDWQAALWRAVNPGGALTHRAALRQAFFERLETGEFNRQSLPERISLFGISTLPPLHLQVFLAMARHCEIHLFLLNPCRHYWSDILSQREQLRRQEMSGGDAETLHLDEGHPLLASLGQSGRSFLRQLDALDDFTPQERYVDPGCASLLTTLQQDILELRPRPEAGQAPNRLAPEEASLQFHACHTPLREVEVLHDLILEALATLPGLTPRDILVMAPDIDGYAPFIHSVFQRSDGGLPKLPYTIADHPRGDGGGIGETLLRLGRLLLGRFGAAEILDLMEQLPLARRFDFGDSELLQLRHWIDSTGIRWGLDAAFREELDLPADPSGTWQAGLDRLLLALCMEAEPPQLVAGFSPAAAGSAANADLLGRFADLLSKLGELRQRSRAVRPLADWGDFFTMLQEEFLDPGEQEWEAHLLQQLFAAMATRQKESGCDRPLAFNVALAWLEERLATPASTGFLSGGITCCTLLPMRSVPFRVIALLGMNDGAFPRHPGQLGFDKMANTPRPGDPNRRNEDRLLFLEALLSARERLLITYLGQSAKENSPLSPSVVVSELLDVIDQGFVAADGQSARQQLLRRHRLQPFSPGYFTPGSPLFSFAPAAHQGALAAIAPRHELPPLLAAPLSATGEHELSVERLRRFFLHPCKAFIRERLGITLAQGEEGVNEREVLTLDNLESYQIGDALLQAALREEEPKAWQRLLAAEGRLPAGTPGEIAFANLWRQSDELAAAIRPHLAAPRPLAIDLTLAGMRLRGEIALQGESGPLLYRNGPLRSKDLLDSWLLHLLVNGVTAPTTSRLFGRGESVLFPPVSDAGERLEELIGFWRQGESAPLPFIPSASGLYVENLRQGKSAEEALEKVRAAWNNSWSAHRAEMNDPWLNLCGGEALLDNTQFAPLAEAVFTPLFAAQEEG